MRRRPWLAALLSLVEFGLGDVYNGQTGKGVRLVVAAMACVIAGAIGWAATMTVARTRLAGAWLLLAFVPALVLRIFGAVRAWREARRLGESPEPRRSWVSFAVFAVAVLLIVLVVPVVVRTALVQAFRVPSGAMRPTLQIGDHFFANKLVYGPALVDPRTRAVWARLPGFRRPRAGEVVVFIYPRERDKDFVKRVVAVGGQTVEMQGTTLRVDGVVRDEPYARYVKREHVDIAPLRVPDAHVYVLGDNRDESYDSRFWGPVPEADVLGRVEIIYGLRPDAGRLVD